MANDYDGKLGALSDLKASHLRLQLRAQFYRTKKPISAEELNTYLHASIHGPAAKVLHASPSANDHKVMLAAAISRQEPEPAFLGGSTAREIRYSLVVLCAWGKWLAVQLSGAGRWRESTLGDDVDRVDADDVGEFLSSDDAVAEKVKLRNMGIARTSMRAKTLEAADLDPVLSPAGLNRQIPESLRFRSATRLLTGTPSTGRINETHERTTVEDFAKWLTATADGLDAVTSKPTRSPFLARFAQPIPLANLGDQEPTALLLDMAWMREGVDDGSLQLGRVGDDGEIEPLDGEESLKLADSLSEIAEVGELEAGAKRRAPVFFPSLAEQSFHLEWGVRAFSLHGDLIDDLRVTNLTSGEVATFVATLGAQHALFAVFDDVRYAFAFGMLFRDREIASQASTLRAMLKPIAALAKCDSEKGKAWTSPQFPVGSVFRVVEDHIAPSGTAPALICDDYGDEWADYIGVDATATPPLITLFHAKHADDTLGASAFQEVVGQAVKNRGRLVVRGDEVRGSKGKTWSKNWAGTAIKRVRRGGTAAKVIEQYVRASAHPECRKRIALVVSFLSAKRMNKMLDRLEKTAHPTKPEKLKPYESQLVHLLVSYVASCREDGAEAVIYCAP